jgi:hypothetical protein
MACRVSESRLHGFWPRISGDCIMADVTY